LANKLIETLAVKITKKISMSKITNQQLISEAKKAAEHSFACLSGFKVGAALLIEDFAGEQHIVKGSNYETQNYRSVCAEKHALQTAHLNHSQAGNSPKFLKIAIFSPKSSEPIFPCGDCRQALFEQNPNLVVLALGANGSSAEYTAQELLPHGFRLATEAEKFDKKPIVTEAIEDPLQDYTVHFPVIQSKLSLLKNIQGLIVVGSPIRAAKLARYFRQFKDWETATVSTYCHIVTGETDREYSLFVVEWPKAKFKIGIASHGIGASGVEILLSELSALFAMANHSKINPIKAVIRSGTRGTLADVPLGTIALTTKAYNEHSHNFPDAELTNCLRQAAKSSSYLLEEGSCLSAQFFWSGQGRTPFPMLNKQPKTQNDDYLRGWMSEGIKWIEMEDYYLNHFAQKYGIASAAVGVAIAKRYDSKTNKFVLSYDSQTKKDRELVPAELALVALKDYLSDF
jgi:homotetrameric cytidine deaminase